jgi:drug/metabolite transporter (DMT)-like permease
MIWSAVTALSAAVLFAGTTNLQRVAAGAVAPAGGGPLHLARRLASDMRWLAGGLVGALALALHGIALALGGVMVVQSVMALGLLIALGLEAVRERRRLLPREVAGAVLVVAGVAVVVGVSGPASEGGPTGLTVLVVCGLVVVASLAVVVRTRHGVGRLWQARLLAASAGACFAVGAVFLKHLAVPIERVLGSSGQTVDVVTVMGWLVGFFSSSAIGGVAVHRAYQVAPLRSVQPALAAAEPVTAFLLGVGLLGEGVHGEVAGFVLLVTGFVAITVGILVGLGRNSGRAAEQAVEQAAARGQALSALRALSDGREGDRRGLVRR